MGWLVVCWLWVLGFVLLWGCLCWLGCGGLGWVWGCLGGGGVLVLVCGGVGFVGVFGVFCVGLFKKVDVFFCKVVDLAQKRTQLACDS